MGKTNTDTLRVKMESTGDGQVKTSLASAEKGFQRLDTAATEASRSVVSLRSLLTTIGSAAVVTGTVRTIVEFEKLQATLKTVTGSSEKASMAFDALVKFSKETPFQIQEVVDAFIKLKALGLDPSEDALVSYGNTASAMGKDLNQFIEAVADAATGEFERLKEFGIKARQQGDEVSFTFRGVTTTVQKNAAAIEGYLRNIGKTDFAGAMNDQMDTLGGAFSNLGVAAAELAGAIGEAGLSDAIKTATLELTEFLNKISNAVPNVGGFLTRVIAAWNTRFLDLGASIAEAIAAAEQFSASITFGKVAENHLKQAEQWTAAAVRLWQRSAAETEIQLQTLLDAEDRFNNRQKPKTLPTAGDGGTQGETKQTEDEFLSLVGAIELQSRTLRANLEGWSDLEEQMREVERVSKKLGRQLTEDETNAVRDAVAKRQELTAAIKESQEAQKKADQAAQQLGFTFTSAFENAILEGESLRDVLQGIAEDIARIAIRNAITQPIGAAVGSFTSGLLFHDGGVVGEGGAPRAVHAGAFANASRYHAGGLVGLRPDEVPAILQRGEEVITRADPRHRNNGGGGITINVVNESRDSEVDVQRSNAPDGSELVNIVVSEVDRRITGGGSTFRAIQSSFSGMRRSSVVRT